RTTRMAGADVSTSTVADCRPDQRNTAVPDNVASELPGLVPTDPPDPTGDWDGRSITASLEGSNPGRVVRENASGSLPATTHFPMREARGGGSGSRYSAQGPSRTIGTDPGTGGNPPAGPMIQ